MATNMANGKRDAGVGVLLASASSVRRAGLEALLKSAPALKLVGSLQGTQAMVQRATELQPDVILADLERDSSLRSNGSADFPVVVLIDQQDPIWTAQALRSGVKAILPREAGIEEILPAILAAHAGLVLLDSTVTQNLVQRVRGPSTGTGNGTGKVDSA